jgi:UPF0042 nucleotide-binding protein
MSGAGKSLALKYLEDIGYYCVDNLPTPLIGGFISICAQQEMGVSSAAIGIDIRGGKLFKELHANLTEAASKHGVACDILFLECEDDVLIKRYKETRRDHPLSVGDRAELGIKKERALLADIKGSANYIIDTTNSLTKQLKERINDIFADTNHGIIVNIVSFGFKYGAPNDSDMVFDVRFIPNPFYDMELRELTGNDRPVRDFVLSHENSRVFLSKLTDMTDFLLPNYVDEGKSQLIISIGCTGGKHRSVTLSNELYAHLTGKGYKCIMTHRDVNK